eukprot:754083-Hanusia_phi.AAC.2
MHSYLMWKSKQGEPEVFDQECAEKLQHKNLIVWAYACVGLCIGAIITTAAWYILWRRRGNGEEKDKYLPVQMSANLSAASATEVRVASDDDVRREEITIAQA